MGKSVTAPNTGADVTWMERSYEHVPALVAEHVRAANEVRGCRLEIENLLVRAIATINDLREHTW